MSTTVVQLLADKLDKALSDCSVKLISRQYYHKLRIYSLNGALLISMSVLTADEMEKTLEHLLGVPVFLNILLASVAHYRDLSAKAQQ